jgi:exodeoxyribonuclease VII large subunit
MLNLRLPKFLPKFGFSANYLKLQSYICQNIHSLPVYSLTDLNLHIRQTLEDAYPEAVWITAEINSFTINSYSGHCYLELSDGEGQSARAKAMIWKKTFEIVHRKFQILTGNSLQKGLKIQVLAKVEFNVQYGLSLIIWDIDAEFSLGEIARKRMEVLQRLEFEGLTGKNKAVELPDYIQNFAIISSSTAAGFQDFTTHIKENMYGYAFNWKLFPAQMQGKEALVSIPQAIKEIEKSEFPFEAILILRGGGSSADLQVFDSYEIAKAISNCQLPVLTGIGHERDDSVADQVANQRFKTPTAVADFLVEKMIEVETEMLLIGQRIAQSLQSTMQGKIFEFQSLMQQLFNSTAKSIQSENKKFQNIGIAFTQSLQRKIFEKKEEFSQLENQLIQGNPLAILAKGYARLSQNKRKLFSVKEASTEEPLEVQLIDGNLVAKVLIVNKK